MPTVAEYFMKSRRDTFSINDMDQWNTPRLPWKTASVKRCDSLRGSVCWSPHRRGDIEVTVTDPEYYERPFDVAMYTRRRFLARAGAAAIALTTAKAAPVRAQSPVRGLFNYIHGTRDAERAFAFHHEVFGVELAPSPFAGGAAAAPDSIRPAAQAGSDPLVWDLTNTHGSRFRTVFMRAPDAQFGLELSEFFDIARSDRAPNAWDPGASTLTFTVRDLDAVVAKLSSRGTPVVTLGGAPVITPAGRAILVRDSDGCLIEVRQGGVPETSLAITVASLARAREFYETLLGFTVTGTTAASSVELRLRGLSGGRLTQASMIIPGTAIRLVLSEFTLPAGVTPAPFDWKLQDVGSPQLQLEVTNLDALIERTKSAGYRFLSVGARPIQRAFGRFVFAFDPDSVLVEFVERATR